MNNDELMHYGVLGMKWGVRRAEKITAKNERRRQKYLNKTQKRAERNKKYAKEELSTLKEYRRQGTNHKDVVERAKEKAKSETNDFYDKYEQASGKTYTDSHRQLVGDLNYNIRSKHYKEQAYKELVDETSESYKHYSKKAKQWTSANQAVMNMPADASNRDYRKAIRAGKKAID